MIWVYQNKIHSELLGPPHIRGIPGT